MILHPDGTAEGTPEELAAFHRGRWREATGPVFVPRPSTTDPFPDPSRPLLTPSVIC